MTLIAFIILICVGWQTVGLLEKLIQHLTASCPRLSFHFAHVLLTFHIYSLNELALRFQNQFQLIGKVHMCSMQCLSRSSSTELEIEIYSPLSTLLIRYF